MLHLILLKILKERQLEYGLKNILKLKNYCGVDIYGRLASIWGL